MRNPPHYCINIRLLICAAVVLCGGCLNHSEPPAPRILPATFHIDHNYFHSDGRITGVSSGIIDDELLFLKITSEKNDNECDKFLVGDSILVFEYQDGTKSVVLTRSDGTTIPANTDSLIFQNRDGNWTESQTRISLEKWTRFLATDPTDCSIEILNRFLQSTN